MNIAPQNEKIIQVIIDSFNVNFALDATDDDEEFIQPKFDLIQLLRSLKSLAMFTHMTGMT